MSDETKPTAPQWPPGVVNTAASGPVVQWKCGVCDGPLHEGPCPSPEPNVLQEADAIIHGERQRQYGDPECNFERIAQAWGAYLGVELTGSDVCMMMGLLKIMRARGEYHRDSLVDLAGYAGLAAIAAGDDE